MTTRRQDASLASGLRQEAPSPTKTRWVIFALLALAGLTLLAYFQPLPVLLLVVARRRRGVNMGAAFLGIRWTAGAVAVSRTDAARGHLAIGLDRR